MIPRSNDRSGIALFAALGLIAMMGLLISGAIAATTFAQRSARLNRDAAALEARADFALASVLSDARALDLADQPIGRAMTISAYSNSRVAVTVTATRFPFGVVWLVAEARLTAGTEGRRRTNLVARWRVPAVEVVAGIMARGSVRLGPGVSFTRDPTAETECRAGPGPDVMVSSGATVDGLDSSRVATSSRAGDSASYYLDETWRDQLDSVPSVIRVHGDTTIAGGVFSGVLLIDGALRVTGTFAITGLVVSRGPIDAHGASLVVDGALLSFADPPHGDYAIDLADAAIRFSPCSVGRALRRALALRPVRTRSWAELF